MTKNSRLGIALSFILIASGLVAQESGESAPFIISFPDSAPRLDPHTALRVTDLLFTALYEGLVGRDAHTLERVPAVASSWELSEDGLRYTFFLRTEARFATGDPVLATDFRDSWLRLISPETNSPHGFLLDWISGAVEFRTGRTDDPNTVGIHARAPRILEVELIRDDPGFLEILTHPSLVPLHSTRINIPDGANDETLLVIGNGPYRVEIDSEPLRLLRSEAYWDVDSVQFERIWVYRNLEPEEASAMYNSGELDWAVSTFSVSHLSNIESIRVNPLFATTYLYFSSNTLPWSNEDLRKTMIRVIPAEELRPNNQFMPAAETLVPPIAFYPTVRGIDSVSDTAAIQRLTEGISTESLPTVSIRIPDTHENHRIASVLRDAWEERLGLDVRIEVDREENGVTVDSTVADSTVADSTVAEATVADATVADATLVLETSIGDFLDPLIFLEKWKSDNPRNPSGFRNHSYDRLIEVALELSGAARMRVLADAEQLLLDSGLIIPVSRIAAVHVIDTERIGGWYTNALDYHPIKSLYRNPWIPGPGIAHLRRRVAVATLGEAQSVRQMHELAREK